MRKYTFKRFYSSFNPNEMTDDQRDTMVAGILGVASTSALVQGTPAMQSSVASLGTKASTFKASRATAATSQAKAEADAATADNDRRAVDAELLSYVSLAVANAKIPADLTGSGVDERPPPPAKPPFAPPDQIDIIFLKQVKGKFKTSPHGFTNRKLTWVVQMTSDPAATGGWTDVYGSGNTRTITGASGSKVWVRYAMLRRGQQSAWSTPVLVTIP